MQLLCTLTHGNYFEGNGSKMIIKAFLTGRDLHLLEVRFLLLIIHEVEVVVVLVRLDHYARHIPEGRILHGSFLKCHPSARVHPDYDLII
jgi:hypothetical protein